MASNGPTIASNVTSCIHGQIITDRLGLIQSGWHIMAGRNILSEEQFQTRIAQEWRRSERSGRPALLVLFDNLESSCDSQDSFLENVCSTFRETDVFGWFHSGITFGAIFLELGERNFDDGRSEVMHKVDLLVISRSGKGRKQICATPYDLPPYNGRSTGKEDLERIAELLKSGPSAEHWVTSTIKRTADVFGSLLLLIILSPLLLSLAACVRLTSRGPALFRQTRAGLGGRPFTLFKFRTMVILSDASMHQEYVRDFISGKAKQNLDEHGQAVFKLTNDTRVTRIGRFLRRTSLDELPQLWNVLRGEMSLVGPRPSLPYEVEQYGLWHRRRVYQLKPGLTGLWQVRGRSLCNFDEMIRMDLQHGRDDSLALYFRVLLETPKAVLHGTGAH